MWLPSPKIQETVTALNAAHEAKGQPVKKTHLLGCPPCPYLLAHTLVVPVKKPSIQESELQLGGELNESWVAASPKGLALS